MRSFAILFLLVASFLPAAAEKFIHTQMVTVDQLQQFLSAAHGVKDSELAKQIYDMRLTERLSEEKRSIFQKDLPGPKSQQALAAIADESEFLDLPPAEVPSQPAPTQAEQDAILARAVDYVTNTVHRLPDLSATRMTTGFAGTTMSIPPMAHNSIPELALVRNDERLAPAVKSKLVVLYRNGRDTYADNWQRVTIECDLSNPVLPIGGEFGEILAAIPEVVAQGHVTWSHWERYGELLLAVFHYSAIFPFQDDLKCPHAAKPPTGNFEYYGEIAVNPDDGSILRITRSDRGIYDWFGTGRPEMEEQRRLAGYGSVEIGGKTYICPTIAVFIGLGPALHLQAAYRKSFDRRFHLSEDPEWENVEDMTFVQYHLFRSNTHILPGFSRVP
jgi:hypothetical protein